MSGFNRIRGSLTLILGLALLSGPALLQAQTAEEKAKEEQLRKELEHRLQAVHQEHLVRVEEALARAREEMAAAQERHGEFDATRLEQMERMLAESRIQAEHAQHNQEAFLEQQLVTQAEALARVKEAQHRHQETLALRANEQARSRAGEARLRYAEAMERAQDRVREAQQVMVQVRARVRLGVSLNGSQGEEYDRQGARIQSIMEDTPAQEAGLQEGDIITHLNGQSLLSAIPGEREEDFDEAGSLPVQRLSALAQKLDAGEEVEVRYLREGSAQAVTFEAAEIDEPSFTILRGELGEMEMDMPRVLRVGPEGSGTWTFRLPDDEDFEFNFEKLEDLKELEMDAPNIRFRSFPEGDFQAYAFRGGDGPFLYGALGGAAGFGLELTELNPGLAEYFSTDGGLLVLNVDEDSTLGLMPGDVIQTIDGRGVEDQRDVRRILESYEEDETVSFTVFRKGREIQVEGTIR